VRDAGIAYCVASQGSLAKTARSLALTGLDRLFAEDARFSATQVPRGKPAPDLFLLAAARFAALPARCAVVEDTPSGVAAAVSAGMRAIGFAADSDETALRAAGAQATARTLHEVGDLLLGAAGEG
jgi:beta-phosphoglucomutase-like phosphatase (HAD superfamily)